MINSQSQEVAIDLRQNCAYVIEKGPVTAIEVA